MTAGGDHAMPEAREAAAAPVVPGPKRVLLHVGTPKTGTSYLQDVLFRNREALEQQGFRYPADRFDAHFLAALDLMGLRWGGLEKQAVGAWERLASQVREWPGTSIVSHEILATASPDQVETALTSLGLHDGVEIHVIISARDLLRQIPAEWQENVKHRATLSYARFLEQIQDPDRASNIGSWFWSVQEVPDILDRWSAGLPPERVHVITVPPRGAPADELWRRFCRVFHLDGLQLDLTEERANPSLGVAETALLRRINRRVDAVVEPGHYRPLVRELLAHRTLSQRTDSPRLSVAPETRDWGQQLSRAWVEELRARSYDVVGDLDELVGQVEGEWVTPDAVDPGDQLPAALDAIKALLVEAVRMREHEGRMHEEELRLRDDQARLERELDDVRGALADAYRRPVHLLRARAVGRLEGSRGGRGTLRVYRRLRGRSSRSA